MIAEVARADDALTLELNKSSTIKLRASSSSSSFYPKDAHHKRKPQFHPPSKPIHSLSPPNPKTEIATARLSLHDITRASSPAHWPNRKRPLHHSTALTTPVSRRCHPDATIDDPTNGAPQKAPSGALFQVGRASETARGARVVQGLSVRQALWGRGGDRQWEIRLGGYRGGGGEDWGWVGYK